MHNSRQRPAHVSDKPSDSHRHHAVQTTEKQNHQVTSPPRADHEDQQPPSPAASDTPYRERVGSKEPSRAMPASLVNFLAGATSGCVSTLLLQPLDVVKTRQQMSAHDIERMFAQANLRPSPGVAVGAARAATSPPSSTTSTTPSNVVSRTAAAISSRHAGATGFSAAPPTSNAGILATMQRIVQNDSALGLWRGVTPTIIRNTLGVGLYFVSLSNLSAMLANHDGTLSDSSMLIAGATARSLAVAVLCPLSVVKTRLELAEYSKTYTGVGDALRKILQREGIRGWFSGLTPAIVRDAPYSALYFLIFLRTKDAMNKSLGLTSNSSRITRTASVSSSTSPYGQSMNDGSSNTSTTQLQPQQTTASQPSVPSIANTTDANTDSSTSVKKTPRNEKHLGMAVNFTAGAFGGGLATLLTQPQDVVKTRMQAVSRFELPTQHGGPSANTASAAQYGSVAQTVRTVFVNEGMTGFFRGASTRFLKRMLGSALTWMLYEEIAGGYERMLRSNAVTKTTSVP